MQSGDKKSIWPKSKKAPLLHDFFPAFFLCTFFVILFPWVAVAAVGNSAKNTKVQENRAASRPMRAKERAGDEWAEWGMPPDLDSQSEFKARSQAHDPDQGLRIRARITA